MRFLRDLNAQQRQAAVAGDGPIMIVAGPGTGKTGTLTARIAYLVADRQARPEEILALTFTNKAAREMLERTRKLLSQRQPLPHITTFHGLCYELLQQIDGTPPHIISELERLQLIRTVRKSADLTALNLREISARLSLAKGSLQPEENPALTTLLTRYNAALCEQHLYDFDDLLRQVYERLQSDEAIRRSVRQRFSHILVDEFQDTSELQYELLRCLNHTGNLFVIGDPLQAIYGFRGANAEMFGRFKSDFPKRTEIVLATNYRSAPEIVRIANAIFPDSPALKSNQTTAGTARAVEVLNEYGEAAYIISEIEQAFGGTDLLRSHQAAYSTHQLTSFRDYAVLYRTHRVARALKTQLSECGIPYQIVGDGSPYDEPTVRTIIHIMRYLAEPNDENYTVLPTLPTLKKFSVVRLAAMLNALPASAKPSELAAATIDACGLTANDAVKRRAINQFINSLVRFDGLGLKDCIRRLDQLSEQNFYDENADAITLLTIHASKGLEFERVFLVAAEEGVLPLTPKAAGVSPAQTAEERRLFYVAMTRAKQRLDILHARFRGGEPTTTSSFLSPLPADTLPRTIDSALESQQRTIQKRRQKRAQSSLF